jgi:transcription-repair coupling factor (superfamily II helicase)
MDGITAGSSSTAYARLDVREPGDYAVRGGIIDLYAPGMASRCGSISSATRWKRSAASIRRRQRSTDQLRALDLVPVSEFQLTTETIRASASAMSSLRRADAGRPALSKR